MLKRLFSKRVSADEAEELWHTQWPLADMESVEAPEEQVEARRAPAFFYEDTQVHAAGVFTAELAGWRSLDPRKALWTFRTVAENDFEELYTEPLQYVTGVVCRPDNNLYRLVVAMGLAPEIREPADLLKTASRAAVRQAVRSMQPDEFLGRRCRIEVEHVRDETGDVTARIKSIAPMGWV